MLGNDVTLAASKTPLHRLPLLADQRESHNDRIGYRADVSYIHAGSAPPEMVGRPDCRTRLGCQPRVLAYRAQTVLGHCAVAGPAISQYERTCCGAAAA